MTRHYCIREGKNGYNPRDILLDFLNSVLYNSYITNF